MGSTWLPVKLLTTLSPLSSSGHRLVVFSKEYISTTQRKNIKALEEGSAQLESINDAFQKYLKVRDRSVSSMEVVCFFEQYAMYPLGKKTFVVLEESASPPGIDTQPIQANHETMCQFEDEDREGYKSISQKLPMWISNSADPRPRPNNMV
jgi:hypothetical protein